MKYKASFVGIFVNSYPVLRVIETRFFGRALSICKLSV